MAFRQPLEEKKDVWIADSGSDGHITNDMKWYTEYTEFPTPKMIKGHSSEPTLALGTGIVLLPALRPEGRSQLEIRDVWFAPTAPYSMLSLNRLEELGAAYDWRTSSLMCMESEVIIASVEPWNGIKVVRLDLEKVATLKDKSKDDNNDNLTDISEPSEPSEPFDEPSEPPEPPANEPDAPDEPDVPDEPAPDNSDDPDAPEELDDIEIDEECHSEETAAEKRPDNRKMAGYAALREEDQKEDRLRQKETHFASKYVVPKTYRAARYNSKWEEWKPAQYGRNEGWTPVLKKQMRYGKTLLGKWRDNG
jgi:hypothetical protein